MTGAPPFDPASPDGDPSVVPFVRPMRRPPHNIEAERAVLGAVMVRNAAFDRCAPLRAEHFAVAAHARIWTVCGDLIAGGRVADPITLRQHLSEDALADIGGVEYLMTLAGAAATVVNAGEYARIIRDLAMRRRVIAVTEELSDRAHGAAAGDSALRMLAEARRDFDGLADAVPEDDGLEVIDPRAWDGVEPPPRRWLLEGWIPMGMVTAFYGDGGTGKSLLMQMLATAAVAGKTWLGMTPRAGRALCVFCEDPPGELHLRQAGINAALGIDGMPDGLRMLSRVGRSNFLMTFPGYEGRGELTPFFDALARLARDFRPDLIILDTAAHVFGGEENRRAQVTEFVNAGLMRLAQDTGAAVVLCAHPSVDGMKSGYGGSGSTAWNGSVRSRLYLKQDPDDKKRRTLVCPKANYASGEGELVLRWEAGVFVSSGGGGGMVEDIEKRNVAQLFAEGVAKAAATGLRVSPTSAARDNYAPKRLRNWEMLQDYTFRQLEQAMNRALQDGLLEVRLTEGPPSKRKEYLHAVAADI